MRGLPESAGGVCPNLLVYFPRSHAFVLTLMKFHQSLRISKFGTGSQFVPVTKCVLCYCQNNIYIFLVILIKKIVFLHRFLTGDHQSVIGTTRRLTSFLESTGVCGAHRNVLIIFIYIFSIFCEISPTSTSHRFRRLCCCEQYVLPKLSDHLSWTLGGHIVYDGLN